MFRNPTTTKQHKPELSEDEEFLYECTLCGIEFGELLGDGSFYVTTQRIIWINTSPLNNDDIDTKKCYSFSSFLSQLMVHALCKDSETPYLFLQIENQENDIKIMNKSYDKLQECYNQLCEGQKLNPCEGDSDDAGDAFMSFGAGSGSGASGPWITLQSLNEAKNDLDEQDPEMDQNEQQRLMDEWIRN